MRRQQKSSGRRRIPELCLARREGDLLVIVSVVEVGPDRYEIILEADGQRCVVDVHAATTTALGPHIDTALKAFVASHSLRSRWG